MPRDHATEADYYLYGIELGILGFEKAIEWADSIIELEAEPEVEIIDIALAAPKGRNGVMDALKEVKGVRDPQMAGRMLLRDLKSLLQNGSNLKAISSKALNVTWVTQMPEEIRWKFDHIDDDISLAKQGIYSDIEQCKIELKEMLELYQYHEAT
ncbi:hypothetical protein SAMN05660691_00388 [Rheinheimera pacifica]|uniref:Uncharacterized protein n=1 Tax=Rheinheimera pacifica TaxID=173990 RepID=A0A1H6JK66_9GAMM|nr:hypothetical protein [Rheinheimera pacifica]SEH59399.1 hypothetical protein SAMN05660691_00388 [Rheinheimera pacifica]